MAGTTLPPVIADATVTLSYAGTQAGIVAGQYYGYCTIADVKYELPNIASYPDLTATTGAPPINMNGNSLIAQEITYAALELQDTLDHFYQMPYTGANTVILLTLRELNAKLACAHIIDRYFSGGEANVAPSAAERRGWVESIVVDIGNGRIRWDDPFGDAQPRGMLPVYQRSQGATVLPSPNDADPLTASGVFSMGRARFRHGDVL